MDICIVKKKRKKKKEEEIQQLQSRQFPQKQIYSKGGRMVAYTTSHNKPTRTRRDAVRDGEKKEKKWKKWYTYWGRERERQGKKEAKGIIMGETKRKGERENRSCKA